MNTVRKVKRIILLPFGTVVFCLVTVNGFEDVSSTNLPVSDLMNNSMDVVSADTDGDGDMDLVIASEFRQNLILLNDGQGKFINGTEGRLPRKQHDSEDIALADFDGDKDPDLIFASEDDRVHEYYLNNGQGFFTDVSHRISFQSKANALYEYDFDRDGDVDILFGNEGQDKFLINDGKGNFTDETLNRLPADNSTTQDIEGADLDKDGDWDIVIGNEDGNRIYFNDGKGVFSDVTTSRLAFGPEEEETRKVDLADVDNDGDTDIFFSNVKFRPGKNPANRLLINNGKGFFTDETATRYLGINNLHSADACFVDVNNDGAPDLLVANIFGGFQQVFINNGKGIFAERNAEYFSGSVTSEAISVEAGDWNKDGKVDLYYGVFRGADILLKGK